MADEVVISRAKQVNEESSSPMLGTRWQVIRFLLTKRFGVLVKNNIWMLLFALPLVAVAFIFFYLNSIAVNFLPFSSNAWAGYPFIDNVVNMANAITFEKYMYMALLFIPCFSIIGLGFAGGMRVIRLLATGEEVVKVRPVFFKGARENFLRAVLGMTAVGIFAALTIISIYWLPVAGAEKGLAITSVIVSILLLLFTLMWAMFFIAQGDCLKLSFGQSFVNGFKFIGKALVQNLIYILVSLLPFVLFFLFTGNQMLMMIGLFLVMLIALSFTALIWTAHSQYVFARVGLTASFDYDEAVAADKAINKKVHDGGETEAVQDSAEQAVTQPRQNIQQENKSQQSIKKNYPQNKSNNKKKKKRK